MSCRDLLGFPKLSVTRLTSSITIIYFVMGAETPYVSLTLAAVGVYRGKHDSFELRLFKNPKISTVFIQKITAIKATKV